MKMQSVALAPSNAQSWSGASALLCRPASGHAGRAWCLASQSQNGSGSDCSCLQSSPIRQARPAELGGPRAAAMQTASQPASRRQQRGKIHVLGAPIPFTLPCLSQRRAGHYLVSRHSVSLPPLISDTSGFIQVRAERLVKQSAGQ